MLNTLDDTITTGRLRALQAQTLQALGVGDFDTATRLSVKLQAFVRAAERLRRHHNGVHVSRSAEQEAAYARALQAASAIRITQHWMRRVMNAEGVGGLVMNAHNACAIKAIHTARNPAFVCFTS